MACGVTFLPLSNLICPTDMPQKPLCTDNKCWWWLIIQSKSCFLFPCRTKRFCGIKGCWNIFDLKKDQRGPWDHTQRCFYGFMCSSVTYKLGMIFCKLSATSGAHVTDRKDISMLVYGCLKSWRKIHLHNVWGVQCLYARKFPEKVKYKRLIS